MSKELFLKKSDRMQLLAIGGALAVGGVVVLNFVGGIGSLGVIGGIVLLGMGLMRGRKPVVRFDATSVLFTFKTPLTVPFHAIESVDQLKTQDIELKLKSGEKVLVPMAKLDDEDGAWLKKALRKEVRVANAPLR